MSAPARQQEAEVFESHDETEPTGADASKEYHAMRRADAKQSDDVIESGLHPALAFERFAGKVFQGVSEEERLRELSSRRGEYAAHGSGGAAFESPLDRYNRLKREVADFEAELGELARESQADELKSQAAAAIAKELGGMQQTLGGLVNNQSLRPFLVDGVTDADLVQQKHVVDRLLQRLETEGRRGGGAAAADEKAADGGAGGRVTYELYYNPQKDQGRRQMNIVDLDRRLAALEGTVGKLPDSKALGFPDVHTAIDSLRTRMEFLDQSRLDSVYRRIKSLKADLDLLQQQQGKVQGDKAGKHQERVDAIFDMMTRWDEAAQQLPAVIARLHSLRELHEESASTVMRVQEADAQLSSLDRQLKVNRDALERVSTNLDKNSASIRKNVESLEGRFDALAKKIALLEGSG